MNEWQNLGSGQGGLNVHLWFSTANVDLDHKGVIVEGIYSSRSPSHGFAALRQSRLFESAERQSIDAVAGCPIAFSTATVPSSKRMDRLSRSIDHSRAFDISVQNRSAIWVAATSLHPTAVVIVGCDGSRANDPLALLTAVQVNSLPPTLLQLAVPPMP
nr:MULTISPECIES: hypothetical protein [unclassified Sphingomonas]